MKQFWFLSAGQPRAMRQICMICRTLENTFPGAVGELRKSSSSKEECSVLAYTQNTKSEWEKFPGLDVS